MNHIPEDFDWSVTTWEGARRENLRRWCALSLRERLQALEDMGDLVEHFRRMRESGRFYPVRSGQSTSPEDDTRAVSQSPGQYRSGADRDEDAS